MDSLFLSGDTYVDDSTTNNLTPQVSPAPNICRLLAPGLKYRNLGKSGLKVSNLGLATWMLSSESIETYDSVLTLAYENGINVFDLSDAYSGPNAEIELGKLLKRKNWKRTSFIIIVKIYWASKPEDKSLSRRHIIDSVKSSLNRLGSDFIDIILIHRLDISCPMEEIVRAMNYVINKGWVMYWGTSKWTPTEIMEAYSNCRQFNCVTPILEQAEYHFFCRDKAELYMSELYNKIGVGLISWAPLTMNFSKVFSRSSLLTESFSSSAQFNSSFKNWTRDRSLSGEKQNYQKRATKDMQLLAEGIGCTLPQLLIAWCLKNESLQCMLIGPTSPEELMQYLQALQLIPKLEAIYMVEIEKTLENRPVRPPMVSTMTLASR